MKYFIILCLFLVSCSKEPIIPQQPKLECSDVLVFKNHYWSQSLGRFVYRMQWKKLDGTIFNMDGWDTLYWSKLPGDKACP